MTMLQTLCSSWSGRRELNPFHEFPRLGCYPYTTPRMGGAGSSLLRFMYTSFVWQRALDSNQGCLSQSQVPFLLASPHLRGFGGWIRTSISGAKTR
jgi:hypothetical protein